VSTTSVSVCLNRFGSASRGDPLYEAGVHLGRLLRTVFLGDYFVLPVFRRELLRVLNRGESVNSLKRAVYAGRVAGHQAKRMDEMQAVADALSLLANIVMAWNTAQMQSVLDRWSEGRGRVVPPSSSGTSRPRAPRGSTYEASSASRSSAMPSSSSPPPGAPRPPLPGGSVEQRDEEARVDEDQRRP